MNTADEVCVRLPVVGPPHWASHADPATRDLIEQRGGIIAAVIHTVDPHAMTGAVLDTALTGGRMHSRFRVE